MHNGNLEKVCLLECNELKIVQNGWKLKTISAFFRLVLFKKIEIFFNFSKETKAFKIKKSEELRGAPPAPLTIPPAAGIDRNRNSGYGKKCSFSGKKTHQNRKNFTLGIYYDQIFNFQAKKFEHKNQKSTSLYRRFSSWNAIKNRKKFDCSKKHNKKSISF